MALLRGVYAAALDGTALEARILAVSLADPDAVICGEAARAVQLRSASALTQLEAASWRLRDRSWLRVTRRRIPPELIVREGVVALTSPALTAIDLAEASEGASLDEALRSGVPLARLREALDLTPRRRGNAQARRLLADSRDLPWSPAERRAHVVLRHAGITCWVANRPVRDRGGTLIGYVDLAVAQVKVAIEIDGDAWHLSPADVLRDRLRDQRLVENGWTVVRFRALDVFRDPERFVASVRTILAARGMCV